MSVLLFVLCAAALLLIVSGVYVFVVGCLWRKDLPWLVEDEIKKTPYGKYFDHIRTAHQWLQDNNAQNVYIQSEDGLKLHAFWIPAENARGTVLFAHGYRSTMLVDFGLAFDLYHRLGMNLLVPDQRCHGQSEGRFITFGVKESRDMVCWIKHHNNSFGVYPMILSGLSMGAATMLYLADKPLPANVKGIIADCGFTSPKEILSCVFKKTVHLSAGPTLFITDLIARLFAGFSLNQEDTRRCLAQAKLPVLLVHGIDDDFVPCEMTKQAYDACTGPKELLLVKDAGHGVSFLVEKEKYIQTIIHFLDDCL